MSTETEPPNPSPDGRAYRRITPSSLAELARDHAGFWRLHVLTEAFLEGWTDRTVETLAESGIDLVGFEALTDTTPPGSPFEDVTEAIGVAVFGFPPLGTSDEAGPHVFAYARYTGSGYAGFGPAPASDAATPGALFVGHYGGEDTDMTSTEWCAVSHWSSGGGRRLLDGEFRLESLPGPGGSGRAVSFRGTPWHIFGTRLQIVDLDEWVLVRYRNGRYRYLDWLLLMLGLRERAPNTMTRPPSNPGQRPFRAWATHPARPLSGQFTVNPVLSGQFTAQSREGGSIEYGSGFRLFEESDFPSVPVGWWDESTPDSVITFGVGAPFHSEYARFRENVVRNSSEIQRRMIYRSDPEYPERVIDRRNDLRHIHRGFSEMGVQDGSTVNLIGFMVRDRRGYVLLIRFATRDVHAGLEDEAVTGFLDSDQLIPVATSHARRIANGISDEQPRRRLLCMLDLVDRVGPERAYDLFTLHPLGAALFIDMSEDRKASLLSEEGLPPDIYKMYPIRIIAYLLYFSATYRDDDARFRAALAALDKQIYTSMNLFAIVLRSGSDVYGPNFYRLRDWVRARQNDADSIYSCYGGVAIE